MIAVEEPPSRSAQYRFHLELLDSQGRCVHEVVLAPADFARAVQAACFDGLRQGRLHGYDPPLSAARLEPRFAQASNGSPRTIGFGVVLPAPGGLAHRADFDLSFFRGRVARLRADLVRGQHLSADSELWFRLGAYLDGQKESLANPPRLKLEPMSAEVPIREGRIDALGQTEPWDDVSADDLPVFVPRRILQEAVTEACRTPENEIGGVLLGHLRRDPTAGMVFLEITCLVPAEDTTATGTSITFTPATWERARQVVTLRGTGENFAGWMHSHPFRLCASCPSPAPPECIAKVLFFSPDDEFVMELSFPQPFMVGLLAAVEPRLTQAIGHLPVRLFGWRKGELCSRGFYVFDD
jgi:proteasome lid subunit RPN8/RPN11